MTRIAEISWFFCAELSRRNAASVSHAQYRLNGRAHAAPGFTTTADGEA
jgi:hypothetical protein